ncbi:conserved hypothetical protein [Mesorhizobium sp. ORS 3359]|nr:conserved hypothetical protein [Mesorhizobium sp. ORS 3359]
MPTHIVVNSLGLTYKGTIGVSIATIPDVCKTPSPGGPIPLPYPNIANQSTLKDGTTTVFAKGGKMIAIKGSQYGMSSGDEPGTVGGVKSNVFKKATDWITYSFDVKMDGKNACRHTDKKFHNDKNTVDLAGDLDPLNPAPGLKEIAEKCNKDVNNDEKKPDGTKKFCPPAPSGADCTALGTKKHKCCENEIKKWKEKNPDADPTIDSEVPYDRNGRPSSPEADANARSAANNAYNAAKDAGESTAGVWKSTYFSEGGAGFKADVVVSSPPPPPGPHNAVEAYDFKFNCEPTYDTHKRGPQRGKPKPLSRFLSDGQADKYINAVGCEPKVIHKDGRAC